MTTSLLLPDSYRPTNLHLKSTVKARFIDGDVLDICERLAEIDPSLYIVELTESGKDGAIWAVMEHCIDGVDRLVAKVNDFDARVLTKIAYLMHVPFEHRLRAIEEENAAYEQTAHENYLEETYDRIGGEFWRDLERCGFIDRPVSYPKLGVAAPGRAR